ncbi:carbonic anhydrase [Ancylobacter sp. SL191]|uniref:carbonic anhydrase n=1 Tax=Ancylobacter sp. SL191 TaxID=2995166 RepID=UPI002270293B|nr:carbonic anhydrase [Ancylobacter sp. SL191]WAC27792.1 carbonic anhydrase [Ancylobacter sp. SL191]
MCQDCQDLSAGLSRRHLLRHAATSAALGSAALASGVLFGSSAATATTAASTPGPSHAEVVADLAAGNARHAKGIQTCTDFIANRAALSKGQRPIAIVVACSDSRVAPEYVFDQAPGRVFVVRVAGNFVDEDGLASMEYAVGHLGVPVIMVLGHSSCGALTAAVEVEKSQAKLPGHLPALVANLAAPVRAALASKPADPVAAAIRENVAYTMKKLGTEHSEVATAIAEGKVKVVGGVYDLATGLVAPVG